jgi:tetratricopeptide (TPR) repeat protein
VHQHGPVHRAIMVVDVERFGDPIRTNLNQLAVRGGLYSAMAQAFGESGVAWDSCETEDRGDGALILVPPDVPKTRLVTDLPYRLAMAVRRHNVGSAMPERMRLRIALHAGEVYHDAYGVTGTAINHAFRLADAPALKAVLDASTGLLALIVSDWLFSEIIRHDPAAEPDSYHQVKVIVKETTTLGWARSVDPDAIHTPADQVEGSQSGDERTASFRGNQKSAPRGLANHGSARNVLGSNITGAGGMVIARRPIPAQLPHDVSGFTGREPELAALDTLVANQENPAVVISAIDGTAGIGKTALAVHFAHHVAPSFPDGQLFVNLRGFDPDQPPLAPRDVLIGFLHALGTDPWQMSTDLDELAAMYRSLVSGRRVLVVLDNAASAEQVRSLLPGAADCLAIVTSRNSLSGLVARDGAKRLTLDVLLPGEAAALIAQIAGNERAASDPAAIDKLTELCGRLPLALRIIADRAVTHRHLSMTDFVEELTLEHGRLDALSTDEKATQVRAVFSWSYKALPPGPARAFRLLALHPGPEISTAAAAALNDTTLAETRQLLKTLTGEHLVEETGRDRYQFHDLIRVYAAECAQTSEPEPRRAEAVRRLLTWYLHAGYAFSRIFNPGNRHVALEPLPPACKPPVFTTYRQALDWAKRERANLIPVVHQAAAVANDAIAWKLPVTLLPIFGTQRGITDLLPALESALAATRQLGDRVAETWVLNCVAEAYLEVDRPAEATSFCQRARIIAGDNYDSHGQWEALYLEGICYLWLERFSDALDCIEQALMTARKAGDLRAEGLSLTWLGLVFQHLGSFDSAIDAHVNGLALLDRTQSRWHLTFALIRLAETYRVQGRFGEAIDQYQRAWTLAREMEDLWAEANILTELGQAQRAEGREGEAGQSWRLALSIFEEFSDAHADQLRALLSEVGH